MQLSKGCCEHLLACMGGLFLLGFLFQKTGCCKFSEQLLLKANRNYSDGRLREHETDNYYSYMRN